MPSYIFGGDTNMSYDQLQQRRRVAQAMLQANSRTPRNVGEGLNAVGRAIAARSINSRADRREGELQDDFDSQFGALFGGGSGSPTGGYRGGSGGGSGSEPGRPVTPEPQVFEDTMPGRERGYGSAGTDLSFGGPQTDIQPQSDLSFGMEPSGENPLMLGAGLGQQQGLPASLISTESGGNLGAYNNHMGAGGHRGHGGRGQFGTARLRDAYNAGVLDRPMTAAEYAQAPLEVQQAVENWHVEDINNFIRGNGLERYIGQRIGGVEVTPQGMLAVAHLGGPGGLQRFLESGGQYNPSDANGTSLSDYMATHGGQGGGGGNAGGGYGGAPAGPNMGRIQTIAELMSNPMASDGQRAVLGALLQREMASGQPLSPLEQIQFERAQLELEQMRNPTTEPVTINGQLVDPSTGEVVGDYRDEPGPADAPRTITQTRQDGSEVTMQWNGETEQWEPLRAADTGATGTVIAAENDLTESQARLTLFRSMQTETAPVLEQIESQWDPSNLTDRLARSISGGNYFQTEEGQQYEAAARAWAEGALRIATGAAATPEEMTRTMDTYFARPGDSPATIQFKRELRAAYDRAIRRALGETEVDGALALPNPDEFAEQQAPTDAEPAQPEAPAADVPEGVDPELWGQILSQEARDYIARQPVESRNEALQTILDGARN